MSHEPGSTVRTLLDLLADDGSIVPIDSTGIVIGSVDDRLLVDIEDRETGEHVTVTAHPWELLRPMTRGVR